MFLLSPHMRKHIVFCFFVGNTVKEIDELRQQLSRRRVVEGGEIGRLVDRPLLYISAEIDGLRHSGVPSGIKILKGINKL